MVMMLNKFHFNLLFAAIISLFYQTVAGATALPLSFDWPATVKGGYAITISRDANFRDIVKQDDSAQSSYAWIASQEGVYHWKVDGGKSKNEIAKGSLIVIAPRGEQQSQKLKLFWSIPADEHSLQVLVKKGGHNNRQIVASTRDNWVLVEREADPMELTVMTDSDLKSGAFDHTFRPSLAYNETSESAANESQSSVSAATLAAPVPMEERPLPSNASSKVTPQEQAIGWRSSSITGYALIMREDFAVTSPNVGIDSTSNSYGAGLEMLLRPYNGLIVLADLNIYHSYHDITAQQSGSKGVTDSITIDESPQTYEVVAGLNLLENLADFHNHLLLLGIGVLYADIPLVPLGNNPASGSVDTYHEWGMFVGGGAARYAFMRNNWTLAASAARYSINADGNWVNKMELTATRIMKGAYYGQVGLRYRELDKTKCYAADQGGCVNMETNIKDISLLLGAGMTFDTSLFHGML